MDYELDCDTCDFATTAKEGWRAHDTARKHEQENPAHFVMTSKAPGDS